MIFFNVDNLYALLCFVLPNIIWILINKKKIHNMEYKTRHLIWAFIFMLYIFIAVQIAAGIGTIWDLIAYGKLENTINLVLFYSRNPVTYILNIIMFIPLGFLLPLIWKNFRNPGKVILTGFCTSLLIELSQLLDLRVTDIDDLIMNTIGTCVGYLIWLLLKLIIPKFGQKANEISKWEPIIYILLGSLGIILLFNWRLLYPGLF